MSVAKELVFENNATYYVRFVLNVLNSRGGWINRSLYSLAVNENLNYLISALIGLVQYGMSTSFSAFLTPLGTICLILR